MVGDVSSGLSDDFIRGLGKPREPHVDGTPSPRWAIVTGLVRNLPHATALIETLVTLRQTGRLDGAVVAAWSGEYDRYPDLLQRIEQGGLLLVECPQPRLKLHGHLFHQSRAVNLALEFVPPGAAVVKLRPDIWGTPEELVALLARELPPIAAADDARVIYRRKPIVHSALLTAPFYINDILMYADRDDLKTIFNFDYQLQFIGSRLGPEQMFFGHAFLRPFALFDLFYRVNAGIDHNDAPATRAKTSQLLRTTFYIEVLALYHLCLDRYFSIGLREPDASAASGELDAIGTQTLEALLLSPDARTGIQINAGTNVGIADRPTTVAAILRGDFRPDDIGEAYLTAVQRARSGMSLLDDPRRLDAAVSDYIAAMGGLAPFVPNLPIRLMPTCFRYRDAVDDPSIVGTDGETRRMQEEVNTLRRRVDTLTAELSRRRATTE